ncbi:MAG: hypothetical protein WEB58_23215 [Planctomycetaceae bacterium]|jgi:hypothetical protein
MKNQSVQRRDFHKLSLAALGGVLAGTASAIAEDDDDAPKLKVDPALLLKEPHTCKGLNACKGKGKGEKNACAGTSACATIEAHTCAGTNACKGQGGCGGYPGQNTCKEVGHCAVPLKKETWATARKQLEHLFKDMDKKLGDAPKK